MRRKTCMVFVKLVTVFFSVCQKVFFLVLEMGPLRYRAYYQYTRFGQDTIQRASQCLFSQTMALSETEGKTGFCVKASLMNKELCLRRKIILELFFFFHLLWHYATCLWFCWCMCWIILFWAKNLWLIFSYSCI